MRSNHPGIVLQDAPKLLTPSDGVSPGCLFLSLFNTEHLLIDLTKLQESENKTAHQKTKMNHQWNLEKLVHIGGFAVRGKGPPFHTHGNPCSKPNKQLLISEHFCIRLSIRTHVVNEKLLGFFKKNVLGRLSLKLSFRVTSFECSMQLLYAFI